MLFRESPNTENRVWFAWTFPKLPSVPVPEAGKVCPSTPVTAW